MRIPVRETMKGLQVRAAPTGSQGWDETDSAACAFVQDSRVVLSFD